MTGAVERVEQSWTGHDSPVQPAAVQTGSHSELERRLARVERRPGADLQALLEEARAAVAEEMSSPVQFGTDLDMAGAAHVKWQRIHRYLQRLPFRDDPAEPRAAQWRRALALVRPLDDLDLLEWVTIRIDDALSHEIRTRKGLVAPKRHDPVYIVLLRHVAARKRKARAELVWAREAATNGWGTCNAATLGSNVLDLHAASVHSRDNPAYHGPVDGAYRKD